MRNFSTGTCLAIATAVVAAVAIATGAASSASAAATDAGPALPRGRFFDPADQQRAISKDAGPFFGLRVHSMDIGGEAWNVACFEYVCDGLRPGPQPDKYDLVRTVYEVRVAPSASDEVMRLPLPPSVNVLGWRGIMGQTRWMRRVGPTTTPVGGFVGRLSIEAIVSDLGRGVGVFDIQIAGTTGLRPMRGDPDDSSGRTDEGRSTSPRHDEGWYVGKIQRKALIAYAQEFGDVDGVMKMLRTLDKTILAGTFEGHLDVTPNSAGRLDYCDIARGAWWFDGLLAWDTRAVRIKDHTAAAR